MLFCKYNLSQDDQIWRVIKLKSRNLFYIGMDSETKILMVLLFLTIAVRYLTFRMFTTGGDSINYWFAAKTLYYGIPYVNLDHQTTRFGVIIPLLLSMKMFGTSPLVSALVPVLMTIFQIVLLYKIGVNIHSIKTGFFASLLFMFFPRVLASGGQILPSTFSITYLLMSFYIILKLEGFKKYKIPAISFSAIFFFLAYESKVTNLYFLPGYFLGILLITKNRRDLILFALFLLTMYIGETILYYTGPGNVLGRLGVIMGTHLAQERHVPISFWELFGRFTKLQLWPRIQFYFYFAASFFIFFFRINIKTKIVTVTALIFYIATLFSVKSINPIIPAMPFNDVYLDFGVPFMMLVISVFIFELYDYFKSRYSFLKNNIFSGLLMNISETFTYILIVFFILALSVAVRFSGLLPENAVSKFFNDPFDFSQHKISLFIRYTEIINNAYNRGIPIVSGYKYPVKYYEMYKRIQKHIKKGINLKEACKKEGINLKFYYYIRTSMPLKSMKLVREVFLDLMPDKSRLPRVKKIEINNNLIHFIIKPQFSRGEDIVKFFQNDKSPLVIALRSSNMGPFKIIETDVSGFRQMMERTEFTRQ